MATSIYSVKHVLGFKISPRSITAGNIRCQVSLDGKNPKHVNKYVTPQEHRIAPKIRNMSKENDRLRLELGPIIN